jgi:hypothetical protein
MLYNTLFGSQRGSVDKVASILGSFEMIDEAKEGKPEQNSPYEWRPEHWIPNPVPAEYDIVRPPWLRPAQAPMSFVGGCGRSSGYGLI